ncbi:MAG: hypothetical protein LBO69_01790 [Ignavibacteria bacterium]|jgi:hypothetical protein|nr:hypothetical protein [Ignavibacteria bacterium]
METKTVPTPDEIWAILRETAAKTSILLAIIFATTLTLSAQFSGGSGTQTDPYQITSKADLEALSDSCFYVNNYSLGKYFLLMNNITDPWDYRGIGYDSTKSFYGNFNGNNHTINLNVSSETNIFVLYNAGTIKKLTVIGVSAGGGISSKNLSTGIIDSCNNNAAITGFYCGGITMHNLGTISNCTNTGNITATVHSGGISCSNDNPAAYPSIINCMNTGIIKGLTRVGGIVGFANNYCHITKCINTNVAEGTDFVGAILGEISGNTTITDCFYDIQMCKYKAVNNQDHPGVTGLPTHLLMDELAK